MSSVGKSLPRKDAFDKVRGNAKFIDDYSFPGMLFAATARSKVARGIIRKIDTAIAKKAPGVKGVFTASDIPGLNINPLILPDQVFLADRAIRFHGEPFALVVAETLQQATEAANLVKVYVEEQPPILSIREALAPSASKIYGDDNIFTRYTIKNGDAHEAMNWANKVFEREYETPYQEHGYLETQGMIAVPGIEGNMTVYGSMQCPFYVHDAVSQILGISKNHVRIIQTTTGGGFGGKEDFPSILAGHASMLANKLNRPVKLVYSREEDIISSSKRHPAIIRMKIGTTKEGKILAAIIEYYTDAGAYATLSPVVLWRGTVHALGPYSCENVLVNSFALATNKVPCGAYRGFGSPQVIFAGESMIDEIAAELDINPLQIRRINGLKLGDVTITSQKIEQSCGLFETLDRAIAHSAWETTWKTPLDRSKVSGTIRKGIGLSITYYGVGLGAGGKNLDRAGANMMILKDGSVQCAVGNTEMGQGARTVLAQIAADALGVPYDLIHVVETDTGMVPDSGPTVASRTTFMSGNAIRAAAKELRARLLMVAADLLRKNIDEIDLIEGIAFVSADRAGQFVSYLDLVKEVFNRRLLTSSFGWYVAPDTNFDKNTGMGEAYYVYSYCTNIAEVAVDTETGQIVVERITSAHDMGKAINPQQVEGQIQGGVLQGMGYSTMEEIIHDSKGRLMNDSFSTYILPTITDAPKIDPIIIEHPYSEGPFGAKGFGELPLMGVAPAVANAVFNATGFRARKIPIKPEDLAARTYPQRESSK